MNFHDHFSSQARNYAGYRPSYTADLLRWLASTTPGSGLCWDVGTGSGQVAVVAAGFYDQVYASDASAAQIAYARPHPQVTYAVEPAESTSLPANSVDLITVGAAIHWLDRPTFYREAARVGRPGGTIAAFSYGVQLRRAPWIGPVLDRYVREVLAPWWTEGHALVLNHYQSLNFPFELIESPEFHATSHGDLEALESLLRTWSGAARMQLATNQDPIAPIADELRAAWEKTGPANQPRILEWPIFGRIGAL